MKTIIIHPLTLKGLKAIAEHYNTTPLRYRIVMKLNHVRQELKQDKLYITWEGQKIRDMELYFKDDLDKYFKQEIGKLTIEINKMGVVENLDYRVEVI